MAKSTKGIALQLDVVHLAELPKVPSTLMLKHVLSTVWSCPGPCKQAYAITANLPVALEVEMGVQGKKHLKLLASALEAKCLAGVPAKHLRSDGDRVWEPA